VIERAMPAVVLLLNTHPDGTVTYGAGLLVDRGLVLTSQHVVGASKMLGAMLYRPGRTSYTPMDGGLSRYLFENQTDIVKARAIAGDATSDLALIRIEADTSQLPTLPIARGTVKPGDRVLALGHPQETVWSFTQGVVGAIEQAAIQHDAAISHGSSGGPLLNAQGEVVGINIAKVTSEATGLAFARPISLAARYLGDRSGAALPLDLSTPEAAAVSCWRGQEIGRLEVGDCFDWEAGWNVFVQVAEEAIRIAPPASGARLRAQLEQPQFKERWIEHAKRGAAGYFINGPHEPSTPAAGPVPPELARARAEAEREEVQALRTHPELRGVFADQKNPSRLQARLRLGIRVDRVAMVGPGRAWVQLAGRNPDGSIYRFSEFYVRIGDRWVQRCPPLSADVAAFPSSFAPTLCSLASFRAHKLEKMLREANLLPSPPSVLPASPAPTPASTNCTTAACMYGVVGAI